MTKEETKKRIGKLQAEIQSLRYRYHVENDPNVTDDVYDSLTRELKELVSRFPEFASSTKTIDRVAGKPLAKFEKVAHKVRMLSLQDAFSEDELIAWNTRVGKLIPHETFSYFAEIKFDGLAVSLQYENGKFVRAATRGDGRIGENITHTAMTIADIPLQLPAPFPVHIEVRGEIVMQKATLIRLNIEQEKKGLPKFANTRNAAAGGVRQLDPSLTKARGLNFFAYDIAELSDDYSKKILSHKDEHRLLFSLGFPMSPYEKFCKTLEDVKRFIKEIAKVRETLPFGTDGVVLSVNELALHERLGIVGKAPRYMIAFKYPAERVTTRVLAITVQVGRTGVLTPLAHVEPTLVAGSTVSKATLHNMDQIERLDIRIGDTIILQKAGDVIPEVVEVLKNLRSGREKKFTMPTSCPACKSKIEKRAGQSRESVAYYCTNQTCPAKNTRGIIHFINAFEIYTVGPKIVERLKDEGLITDAADLFSLTEADLSGLERFGEKSAKNIIESIEGKKSPELPRFIMALGILHVGEETARDLASYFGTFATLLKVTKEDLEKIPNIGPAVSESLITFFKNSKNQLFIKKLLSHGVSPRSFVKRVGGVLEGKTFVLTGTLPTLSRVDAKKKIQTLGGHVATSVSKYTDFVLAGENPGSKYDEAKALGIKIIDETTFLKF